MSFFCAEEKKKKKKKKRSHFPDIHAVYLSSTRSAPAAPHVRDGQPPALEERVLRGAVSSGKGECELLVLFVVASDFEFFPQQQQNVQFGMKKMDPGVSLYSRRVLIKDKVRTLRLREL